MTGWYSSTWSYNWLWDISKVELLTTLYHLIDLDYYCHLNNGCPKVKWCGYDDDTWQVGLLHTAGHVGRQITSELPQQGLQKRICKQWLLQLHKHVPPSNRDGHRHQRPESEPRHRQGQGLRLVRSASPLPVQTSARKFRLPWWYKVSIRRKIRLYFSL